MNPEILDLDPEYATLLAQDLALAAGQLTPMDLTITDTLSSPVYLNALRAALDRHNKNVDIACRRLLAAAEDAHRFIAAAQTQDAQLAHLLDSQQVGVL